MSDEKLPRIICDECMVDAIADVHRFGGGTDRFGNSVLLNVRCSNPKHEIELLVDRAAIDVTKKTMLWSDIECASWGATTLQSSEKHLVDSLLASIQKLGLIHRVRRSQGAAQYLIAPSVLDPVTDTLMLFRADKEPEPKLVTVPLPPDVINCQHCSDVCTYKVNGSVGLCTCSAARKWVMINGEVQPAEKAPV